MNPSPSPSARATWSSAARSTEGAITVEVKHTSADSFLSGVIRLVQEAQASKSRTQDIANRAAFWLTVIALSVSTLTVFAWLSFPFGGRRPRAVGIVLGPAVGAILMSASTVICAVNARMLRLN